jgi:hypothetical protein
MKKPAPFLKRVLLVLLPVLALALAGCTGTELVPLEGDPHVSLIWVGGRQAALSTLPDSEVAVSGVRGEGDEILFHVGYRNVGAEPVDAVPERITVEGVDRQGRARSLYVYPAEEYLDRMRTERNMTLFFQALSAAERRRVTYSEGHSYGPDGVRYWSSTTTRLGPDAGDFFRLFHTAREYHERLAALARTLLKRTTLRPGQSVEGIVVVEATPPFNRQFHLAVLYGDDLHRVALEMREVRR